MKHIAPLFTLLLFCLFFIGCGKQEEQNESWQGVQKDMDDLSVITDRTEYYDITVDSKQFDPAVSVGAFFGTQFFQGEPIEIRMGNAIPEENNHYRGSLCLYRLDGTREILIPDLSLDAYSKCYLDQDGACYTWVNSYTLQPQGQEEQVVNTTLTKYLSSGEIQFVKEWSNEERILDFRQLPDGSVYLILEDKSTEKTKLLELDTDTGKTTEATYSLGIGHNFLGESGGSLALYKASVYDEKDFVKINPKDGDESFLLSLNGTSYMFPEHMDFYDFQILDNGNVEILWAEYFRPAGKVETLSMGKVEQTPIILRGTSFTTWLLEQINLFNQNNDSYHVIPEPCGAGNDQDDFARLTSIQLSAGKGPDILCGDFMHDYLMGMMAKGSLEDLSPYLESSHIRKKDYFSFIFNNWRYGDKIYGVSVQFPFLYGYKTSKTLLGDLEAPDGEAIIDALLSNTEDMVYLPRHDSQDLLNLFLSGSDSLWGMVDWEQGKCHFGGELFQKLLEAAKRYGDDGRTNQDSYPTEQIDFQDIFEFDTSADLEKSGMIQTGVLFDDGYHAAISSFHTMAVNANSSVKEGAWEFISFLLSQEVQSKLEHIPPIQKEAFDLWIEKERSKVADGKIFSLTKHYIEKDNSITTVYSEYTEDDITDEKVEEYKRAVEEARPFPFRTIPILSIIREESEYYFNGSKTAEEVGAIVTNRVQLYLDESR